MEIEMNQNALQIGKSVSKDFLEHYGKPRRSGRYPYGSGENPYQSTGGKRVKGSSSQNNGSRHGGSSVGNSGQKRKHVKTSGPDQVTDDSKYTRKALKEAKRLEKEMQQREKILKNPRALYKHRDKFTEEEIQKAMKRFQWEKQLRDIGTDQLKAGKTYADAVIGYANTAIEVYNMSARFYNTFKDDSSERAPYIEKVDPSKNRNAPQNKDKDKKKDKD